jgi:enoyl-CoA hydratase/carnithine racemase
MSADLSDAPLLTERRDHVLLATLNRPRRRNALDASLIASLRRLWSDREALRDIRCIVLTGAAPGFCSGADMSLLASARDDVPETAREELSFLPGLQVDAPVIVAVNGVCAGGGLHFVADADIALASDDASFLDPHVSVGQVSALEPLSLLPRSRNAIVRMALIGRAERIDAAQALSAGLVSEVVPADELLDRALQLAELIAENSPAAVAVTRRRLRQLEDDLLERALEDGWTAIRAHWSHPDAHEGPRAFIERRRPRWAER